MAGKEEAIKTEIKVDGEKEYKQACEQIGTSLRKIGSEMKVVSATYADNAKSTAALVAKQDVLKKQYAEQEAKVKAAEKALKSLKDAGYAPTSKEVQNMETQLNSAKAAMMKTETQIKQLDGEIKKSKVNWEAVGNVVGKVGKAFGVALAAMGTAAVGAATALGKLTVDAAAYADNILTESAVTRVAAEDLQKYEYALNFIDGDINVLTKSMAKNIKSMDAARDGSAAYADAYSALGVSVTDANGNLRDSEEVYWECIDALGGIENETERDALAMQLFGKSAQELNPIIDAGSEAFKAMGEEAEEMGAVMSDEALAALGQFDDKVQTLKASFDGLKRAAGLIALPFLDTVAAEGIPIIAAFSKGLQDANGDVTQMSGLIGDALSSVLNLVISKLPEFIAMGVEMVKSLVSGIGNNAGALATAAVSIIETLISGLSSMLPIIITGAAQIVVGVVTGIAQSLPTLIPQVVEMIMTIVQTLLDNIPLLIDAALQLVVGLAEGLLAAIPVLVAALPEIINSIITTVLEAIPLIIQAGIDLLSALVTALPTIIAAVVTAIPQIINGIITALVENIPIIIQAGIDLFIALIQALPQIITTIVAAIPQIIQSVISALVGNIDQIIACGIQIFVALIQNMPAIIAGIIAAIPQIISALVTGFASCVDQMIQAGADLIAGIGQGIINAAAGVIEKAKEVAGNIVSGVKSFLGIASPSTVFAEIGGNMAAGIGQGFGSEMGGVEGNMTSAIGGAGTATASEAIAAVNNGISSNVGALDSSIKAIVERFTTQLNAQQQRFVTAGTDSDKYFSMGLVSGIPMITQRVPQIMQPCITAISGYYYSFYSVGYNMINGISAGMLSQEGSLVNQLQSMLNRVVSSVRVTLKIASPSKVFATIGEQMAAGLGVGFVRGMDDVQDTISGATLSATPKVAEATNKAARRGTETGAPAAGGVNIAFTQYVYANETSYAGQQREASKQARRLAREVMA